MLDKHILDVARLAERGRALLAHLSAASRQRRPHFLRSSAGAAGGAVSSWVTRFAI